MEDVNLNRIYIHTVKSQCNAKCKFCITKEQFNGNEKFKKLPEKLSCGSIFVESLEKIRHRCNEIEITGGGEPTLNRYFGDWIYLIRSIIPNAYIKLYTNGLNGIHYAEEVDELNISRVHWDNDINSKFMGLSNSKLFDQLKSNKFDNCKIRLQIPLISGCIDSNEKLKEWIDMWGDYVDVFMVRELFGKCSRIKNLFAPMLDIENEKVKLDKTGDYCDSMPIIATDGKLYKNWKFSQEL